MNYVTPLICLQELVQSFIINQIIIKSNILNIVEGLQMIRSFCVLMPKFDNFKNMQTMERQSVTCLEVVLREFYVNANN
jgi:hypothetical protein